MTLLDHLWQSTLVAVLVYGLSLLLRNNRAAIRHGLWFAASLKFLLPFCLLAALGRMTFAQTVPAGSLAVLARMRPVAMPFSASAAPAAAENFPWLGVLAALWLLGLVSIAAVWLVQWLRLRATVRSANMMVCDLPIPVRTTPLLLEPGLVGIWRPVILLPDGIMARLSHSEMDAILTHELCHLRRRDNLLAAIHMLVEAVFWFHPLVWFIGARLVEERERACDETVLAGGRSPLEYAQAVLKVCRLYLRSPLACASGISGAGLDQRITAIMARDSIREIDPGTRLLLAAVLAVTLMTPLVVGGLKSAPTARIAQSLVLALTPAAPADVIVKKPAIGRPRQTATRHRRPTATLARAVQPSPTGLTAPKFDVSPVLVAMPVPKFDAGPVVDNSEITVCRAPQQLAGSRLMGPQACLPQSEWDRIKKANLVLMPDGHTLVASYDKRQALNAARPCAAPTGLSSSVSPGTVSCF